MGGASIWHWVIVGIVVMLLFGRGKISEMMGDVAKGIKAFKKGMSDEDAAHGRYARPAGERAGPDDRASITGGFDPVERNVAPDRPQAV